MSPCYSFGSVTFNFALSSSLATHKVVSSQQSRGHNLEWVAVGLCKLEVQAMVRLSFGSFEQATARSLEARGIGGSGDGRDSNSNGNGSDGNNSGGRTL